MIDRRTRFRPLPLAALLLLGLLVAAATLDLRAARPPASPTVVSRVAGQGDLLAGAGRVQVQLPPDGVLATYSAFGRRPTGGAQPLHARALVLEAGGARTALVLLELTTLPPSLLEAVQKRVASVGAGCALVAVTHTHSGPGGYDRAFLPQLALGRFDPRVEEALLQAVEAALAAAVADLAPATLAVSELDGAGLASNRDHRGGAVDDRLDLLALERKEGGRVATLVRLAAHPTLLPRKVGPAGDWPGELMARLDEAGGVAFVLQGAGGDARPTRAASPGPRAGRASTFADTVAALLATADLRQEPEPSVLGCAEVEVDLPAPDLRGMVPPGLGRLVSNLADPAAPRTTRLAALRLGEQVLLGIPGEPLAFQTEILEKAAAEAGLQGRVVGLAQGYVSYLVGPAEMEAGSASARNSWFGEALAPRLIEGARVAAEAVIDLQHQAGADQEGNDRRAQSP